MTVDSIIREVLDNDAGRIGTHSAQCYLYHAACLAYIISELTEKGVDK